MSAAERLPLHRDGIVLVAAGLLLLALGLPWSPSTLEYIPGFITPSMCVNEWSSGTVWCSPMYVSPGMTVGSGQMAGLMTTARLFLVVALVLVLFAQGRKRMLQAAAITVILGLVIYGLGFLGGQLAAGAAAILLLLAASRRHDGSSRRPTGAPLTSAFAPRG